jgi:hypothetical protein
MHYATNVEREMMKGKPSTKISLKSCFMSYKEAERVGNERSTEYTAKYRVYTFSNQGKRAKNL